MSRVQVQMPSVVTSNSQLHITSENFIPTANGICRKDGSVESFCAEQAANHLKTKTVGLAVPRLY